MSHKPAKRSKTERPTELAAAAAEEEGWAVLPLHVTDGNKRLMDEYVRKSRAQSEIDFPAASWALNSVALNRVCKMAALDGPLHVKLIGTDSKCVYCVTMMGRAFLARFVGGFIGWQDRRLPRPATAPERHASFRSRPGSRPIYRVNGSGAVDRARERWEKAMRAPGSSTAGSTQPPLLLRLRQT